MRDLDARLKALISTLDTADRAACRRDPRPSAPAIADGARRLRLPAEASSRDARRSSQLSLRNIVLRVGRPVLAVVGGVPQIQFTDGESEVWRSRLQASSDRLQRASRAVGRIDVIGLPQFEYVGTGWLVERNTIATNRHVAREFGRQIRGRFAFKNGSGARPIRASIDFLEEIGRPERLEFQIVEILHIEDEKGPDFALLRVEETSGGRELAAPIPLAAVARPAGAANRGDRVSRPGQAGSGRPVDAVDLRRRVRQEAARAGPGDGGAVGRRAARLLDAWR